MNSITLKQIITGFIIMLTMTFSIGMFANVDSSYATDATSKDYAKEFLEDGSGSTPGWDNDVITEIDPNVGGDGLEGASGKYIDAGWSFLFTIDKFLVGLAVLFFVGRIAGRGIWELAFGGSNASVPAILGGSSSSAGGDMSTMKGTNRPISGGTSGSAVGTNWLIPMCKSSLMGFIISAGVILILNVVAGLVLFGLGILPPPNFSYFNL